MTNRYNSYKDSRVEWIGNIPNHWDSVKLKRLVRIGNGKDYKNIEIEEGGYPVLGTGGVFSRCSSYLYEGPSVLLGRKGTIDKPQFIDEPFWTSDTLYYTEITDKILPHLLYHLVYQIPFSLFKYGSTIPSMSKTEYEEMKFPIPPLNEQKQIVQFLDTKTSLIDSLLKKTKKKIKLLKEQRSSLINEVVTKGLNPNVEFIDSGVEWIGEIPSHWVVKPLKFIIENLNSGVSVNSENVPVEDENEMGILKTSSVYGNIFRPNENKKILITEYQRIKCPVLKDTIIISRMNTPQMVGSSGYVDRDYKNLFLPDRLWITEIFKGVDLSVKWLSYVLKSNKFRSELSSRSTGTSPSMKNITKSDLLTIRIPYLLLIEQQQIVDFLDKKTNLIDSTISIEEKRIEHLKEYRQSLISEVVTGKIKVTN
ncbi:restriction endonuclease subunit S [uncultured Zobellia sp.]|uniref:restriction endonuclease subunit S n=1 Tax=uncultured Zobellia sp. TaxID=255433 RepID=UPI00259A27BD|nr:restriction endonuclease subunit S [uncultured Zobellia sp.]